MRAVDVMRKSFATIKPDTPIAEAARLLLQTNQRGLPVLGEDGSLVGIVSEGDLLHRDELGVKPPSNWLEELLGIEEGGAARERMRALRVGAVMMPDPVCVDEDASVDDVVIEMDVRNVGQIPVVTGGRVIGIISRVELIFALEQALSQGEDKVRVA